MILELRQKMKKLQEELNLAQQNKARALSMAQQTKAGHVYVISNIGSFGDNIFKIGMQYSSSYSNTNVIERGREGR